MKHEPLSARPQPRPPRRSTAQVFAVPLVLLIASLAGLVLGLTGDGLRDLASAALLLLPLLAIAAAWQRRG